MYCPFDGSPLQVVNRSGIEIDWCPDCRGVWLERGELDQLIDRLAPPPPAHDGSARRDDRDDWDDRGDHRRGRVDDDWDDERSRRDGSRRRRGGLLGEIFDF